MSTSFKPLITTIIPTYRRPKLLRRAIRSVLNQTYPHFQVCVYDNNSGDETANVVAEFAKEDSRICYYCHTENIGAAKNFLYGVDRIETPFFSFLSDDDYLLPNFFKITLEMISDCDEAMFAITNVIHIDSNKKIVGRSLKIWKSGIYYPGECVLKMIKNHPEWTGTLFKKEILDEGNKIDIRIHYTDFDYLIKLADRYTCVVDTDPGAVYTVGSLAKKNVSFKLYYDSWIAILSNIDNLKNIDVSTKEYGKKHLLKKMKNRSKNIPLQYLYQRNFDDAFKSNRFIYEFFGYKYRFYVNLAVITLVSKNKVLLSLLDNIVALKIRSNTRRINTMRKQLACNCMRKGHKKIKDWLGKEVMQIINEIDNIQKEIGLIGNIGEIGILRGKLFILLYCFLQDGEKALAIDLFGKQEFNLDNSGKGNKEIFLNNLKKYAPNPEALIISETDSTQITSSDILQKSGGRFRLFSVDGGHLPHIVEHDLKNASEVLIDGGVIILDDYFNEKWPGVSQGTNSYFLKNQENNIVPFAIGANKLFFTTANYAPIYLEHLPTNIGTSVKYSELFGSKVICYSSDILSLKNRLGRTKVWGKFRDTRIGSLVKSVL